MHLFCNSYHLYIAPSEFQVLHIYIIWLSTLQHLYKVAGDDYYSPFPPAGGGEEGCWLRSPSEPVAEGTQLLRH